MLNVSFFGAGPRAQPYLQALGRRPDVAVTAVCDVDRRAAEQTAAGWGSRVYGDARSMLSEARPDAVWICVEAGLQGDVLAHAVELGIPFFIEPPGAVDFQRAQFCAKRVADSDLVTTVGFVGRYADIVHEAKEYLGANPIALALTWWLRQPEDGPTTAEALLWTDACRFIDALRWFCGEVARVRALRANAPTTAGGLVVQLEFQSGTVGVVTCASFARAEPRVELELSGDGWSLQFGPDLANLRLAERDKTTLLRCLNAPAADHVTAFLAAVVARSPSAVLCNYPDAVQTLAVCQAASLSARESRPVTISEILGEDVQIGGDPIS
jgi:myo-inositol 2-dehydrogenase / D-chiro-inositol 1-dehydrogenase